MKKNNSFNSNILGNILTKPILCLCLIATITVLLISSGSLNSIDSYNRLQVTHSLWMNVPQVREGDLPENNTYVVSGRDGKNYATWGIGQSLIMLPADVISYKVTSEINKPDTFLDKIRTGIVSYLTFTPINVLSIIISFFFIRNLGFNNRQSIFGSLTLLFGTSFLSYAQVHQENSLLFLLTLSGYALSLKWVLTGSKFILSLSALALGFGILVRIVGIIDILSVFLFVFSLLFLQAKTAGFNWHSLRRRILEYTFICGSIYLFYLALDRLYHWMRFGTLSGTYSSIWAEHYKASHPYLPQSFPFSVPFEVGFFGVLFSPERSIFLFNPLLLITLILSVKYWKRINPIIKTFIFSNIFLLFAYTSAHAKWFLWGGAGSWGPRYLTTSMQLLSLLAIPLLIQLYPYIEKGFERTFYKIIFLLNILIQLSSVVIDYNLELAQGSNFVVVQRMINLVALLTRNFEQWGLRPQSLSSDEVHSFTIPRFLPWVAANELPGSVSYALQVVWFGGLIALIALVFILVKNTASGIYDDHQKVAKQ